VGIAWRGWCDGVSRVFDSLAHRDGENICTRAKPETSEFAILRMLYSKRDQVEIVRKTNEHAKEVFDRLIRRLRDLPEKDFKTGVDRFLLEVGISLLKSIHHFKNETFQSEDEWRVLTLDPI
jgi:hypothetical protein